MTQTAKTADVVTELLPCPFCGGEVAISTIRYPEASVRSLELEQSTYFGVNCVKCGANNSGGIGYLSPEQAGARWNTRPNPITAAESDWIGKAVGALRLGVEYDELLLRYKGPQAVLFDGDVAEIDAAYDKWVAAQRALLSQVREVRG